MHYRHNQDFHGRVPAGPEPEFVETEFGEAIVYANDSGNVVAQTADPERPLVRGNCGFDIATEQCWDGSGSRSGPHHELFRPDHMRTESVWGHKNEVSKALSRLIMSYAARNARALAELAVADAEHRLQEIDAERYRLRSEIENAPHRPAFRPVVREMPIGPVIVSLPSSEGFRIEGAGFGGTCNIDGTMVEYRASLPLRDSRPWAEIKYIDSDLNRFEVFHDRANEEMLVALRDGLRSEFAADIERVKGAERIERCKKDLAQLDKVHASLSAKKAFQEGVLLENRHEEAAAPTM